MRTIDRQIVAAVIFSTDGKILFGRQRSGGAYEDCWHIPGGGIEEGERPIQALIREVSEEVGLVIEENQIELLDNQGSGKTTKTLKTGEKVQVAMNFTVYLVSLPETAENVNISLNDDLVDFTWENKKDLPLHKLKYTPPSLSLFTRLGWI